MLLAISCKDKITTEENPKTQKELTKIVQEKPLIEDSDCIFENKPKELTKEWLKQAGFENFTWNAKKEAAVIIFKGDTLFIHKGGCNHLVSTVEFTTKILNNNIFDSKQLDKINDLACKFKFENYCTKILNGEFDKIESNTATYILEFEDDNPDDNLISNGIEITEIGNLMHVKISEYYD